MKSERGKVKSTILLLTILFSFSFAGRVKVPITKKPLTHEEKRTYSEMVKRAQIIKSRVSKRLLPKIRASARANRPETLKVLVLRVEFVKDDDTLTTGNGKMDLKGVGKPYEGLLYDPPHTKQYFERLMQFLRNYYRANSLGRLEFEWDIMPEGEFESYQLPRKMSYYGHIIPFPFYTYGDLETMETGLCRLFRDAIKVADKDPMIDFSKGNLLPKYDAIVIFHAGSAWQTTGSPLDLWAGMIDSSALHKYLGKPYILANEGEIKIYDAAVMPEMARFEDYMTTGIEGMFVHEFAHLLGAYDLYDVTGYTMGVGGWDIMGSGGYLGYPPGIIPAMHSAFHKVYLDWLPEGAVKTIETSTKNIPLHCSEVDSSGFSKIADSLPIILKIPISPKEYFLIENRQEETRKRDTLIVDVEDGVPIYVDDGEWDFFLPGSGVLIWHIDENIVEDNGPTNTINIPPPYSPHKGVDLEEADGIQDFDAYTYNHYELTGSRFDAFFKGGYNDSFTPNTNPNSDGYEGKSFISIKIHDSPDTVMRVSVDFEFYQEGFPKILSTKQGFLSPNYGDLDGDGEYEVIVPTRAGYIYAWRSDGTPYTGDAQGIFASLSDSIPSTIAIGDVTGDGKSDVAVGCEDGKVYAFYGDSLLGKRAARISGFPVSTNDRITSSPLLADLDGDGTLDIIIGSTDMNLYAWNGKGEAIKGFPVWLGSEIRGCPAITDEKNPEIVVLGADNRVFLIDKNGKKKFSITLSQSPNYAIGSPVIADFDGDGEKDIAVIAADGIHSRLFLLDKSGDIKDKGSALLDIPCNTSPAVGDINHDGLLDIVVAAKNKIYALNYNGTLLDNFPVVEDSFFAASRIIEIEGWLYIIEFELPYIFNSSPLIADGILIGSPEYGVLGFDSLAKPLSYTPLFSSSGINGTGLFLDMDKDGDQEFCIGSDSGVFYVWDLPLKSQNLPWHCFLSDPRHTGIYKGGTPEPPEISSLLISDFYAYPNPCEYGAKLRYKLGKDVEEGKVGILDISGKLLFEEKLKELLAGVYNELPLDFSEIPSGVYILRLEINGGGKRETKFYKLGVVK